MRHARPTNRIRLSARFSGALLLVSSAGVLVFGAGMLDDSPQVSNRAERTGVRSPDAGRTATEHPLVRCLQEARKSEAAIASVRDYEATFTKRELVGRTVYADQMVIKHRKEPFSVYLRFVGNNEGREVLYFDGRNQGKLVAHEAPGSIKSIVGTVTLDPKSSQAMAEGRYPITEIGMLKMIGAVIRQWEAESQYGETEVQFYPDAKLGNAECMVIESTHPQLRRQFKFQMTRLFIDKKTHYPIRLEQWGFPDRKRPQPYQVEEYTYTNLKTNIGLTDADFDVRNRNYRF